MQSLKGLTLPSAWAKEILFCAGVLLGLALFSATTPHSALAALPGLPPPGLGSHIVCLVFTDLNQIGTPIPVLDGGTCPGGSVPGETENTLALCSDGKDNDGNGFVDLQDISCASFRPHITVTKVVSGGTAHVADFPLFINGLPVLSGVATTTMPGTYTVSETASSSYTGVFSGACNSGGQVILAIGDTKNCTLTNTFVAATSTSPTTTSTPPADTGEGSGNSGGTEDADGNGSGSGDGSGNGDTGDTGGGGDVQSNGGGADVQPSGGGGGGGGGAYVPFVVQAPSVVQPGVVLGATTGDCSKYLSGFIRVGKVNDVSQVKRLQQVLVSFEQASLMVNGIYDAPTLAAVNAFQAKYASEVLIPWGESKPTGYVFLTTRKKVNEVYCKGTKQFPLNTSEAQQVQTSRAAAVPAPSIQRPGVTGAVHLAQPVVTIVASTTPPAPRGGWWGSVQSLFGRVLGR